MADREIWRELAVDAGTERSVISDQLASLRFKRDGETPAVDTH